MENKNHTVSFTADELRGRRERGEDRTDWARVDRMTEVELEAAIASDPDEAGMVVDRRRARLEPVTRAAVTMRVDDGRIDPAKASQ